MIDTYNSPILKWERYKEFLRRHRPSVVDLILGNVEKAIYTALENGEKANIGDELEKALEGYRRRLIDRGKEMQDRPAP